MKRAVSISIGDSSRDKAVEIELLGQKVHIERIGTNGDMEKAAQLYRELDGKVAAFGVGGTDLAVSIDGKEYKLHSVRSMVRYVEKTPIVDGSGLKYTLESKLASFIDSQIGDFIQPRRALITSAMDRWGMAQSFIEAGYVYKFGDLMFALGIPIPLRSIALTKLIAALLLPIVSRLPFEWLYPTGSSQNMRTPKWPQHYAWAKVIAGDAHFIKRYMPNRMDGKVIVTNTTTQEDVELFRQTGVSYLVTSTPVLDGRSFGTNMMEAALVAVAGEGKTLTRTRLKELLDQMGFEPQIQKLN